MKINLANIKKARNLLNKRECVAIPTETVYGIAGNAYSDTACKKIFRLKKRPMNNPLIIHYYDLKIRSTLGAASNDSVIEVASDGARVRKINKNELSKSWMSARKAERDELDKLINAYRITASAPIQVAGDDTVKEGRSTRSDDLNIRTRNYI